MQVTTFSAISTAAKQTAARAAARAYARRCSWVEADDLESEAWVGILKAPAFNPERAVQLSRSKLETLSPEEQLREQMHWFYYRVGIRWLSSYVQNVSNPVRVPRGTTVQMNSILSLTAHPNAFTDDAQPLQSDDLASQQLRQRIVERITELMGSDRESEIGAAFLLRDPEAIEASDIATLFGTTRRNVYYLAERLEKRLRKDTKTFRLFAQLVEAD